MTDSRKRLLFSLIFSPSFSRTLFQCRTHYAESSVSHSLSLLLCFLALTLALLSSQEVKSCSTLRLSCTHFVSFALDFFIALTLVLRSFQEVKSYSTLRSSCTHFVFPSPHSLSLSLFLSLSLVLSLTHYCTLRSSCTHFVSLTLNLNVFSHSLALCFHFRKLNATSRAL